MEEETGSLKAIDEVKRGKNNIRQERWKQMTKKEREEIRKGGMKDELVW